MGGRLVGALQHVAEEHDELRLVVKGFERHMKKNPISDEDIIGGLSAIRAHIDIILADDTKSVSA